MNRKTNRVFRALTLTSAITTGILVVTSHARGGGPACQPPPHWEALGAGASNQVNVVATWDPDGSGPAPAVLLMGGPFESAGGITVNNIAQWDGTSWSALDQGVTGQFPEVDAIAEFDEDGDGPNPPALFVGGEFSSASGVPVSNIARWNGKNWSAVGTPGGGEGTDSFILSMFVFDDGQGGGPALYVGGNFTSAGGVFASGIARWDGTSWSDVGGGVAGGFLEVSALQSFDEDGDGPNTPKLFVGGHFTSAGGVPVTHFARWDPSTSSWSVVGSAGASGFVHDMAVFDDGLGGGPALYVGGAYNMIGGVIVAGIGRWNGEEWSSLSSTVNAPVQAVTVFDEDGAGPGLPALYAGGNFTFAGGMPGTNKIARWNGTSWSSVGGGISGSAVLEMVVFDPDGPGAGTVPGALVACGLIAEAGGIPHSRIAQWVGCEEPRTPGDINGDGIVNVDDLLLLLQAWGNCPPKAACPADLAPQPDGDGFVNVDDLLILLQNWT